MSQDQLQFSELGRISWLWMNSSLHATWSTQAMMRNTIPPVSNGQYKIVMEGEFPVAYASWAFFSADAERRYILKSSQIQLEDWCSGERMWFIDYISPFSLRHTLKLKSLLRNSFPDTYARALRVQPGNDTGRVLTYFGREAPEGWRQRADIEILSHFTEKVEP